MDSISKVIKTERLNKNFTQRELAERLGVTQDSISLWENGKRIPDTQYILSMCKVFEVSSDYLLGLEDDFGTKVAATMGDTYTTEERDLIAAYRKLPADSKKLVLRMIGADIDTESKKKKA